METFEKGNKITMKWLKPAQDKAFRGGGVINLVVMNFSTILTLVQ